MFLPADKCECCTKWGAYELSLFHAASVLLCADCRLEFDLAPESREHTRKLSISRVRLERWMRDSYSKNGHEDEIVAELEAQTMAALEYVKKLRAEWAKRIKEGDHA